MDLQALRYFQAVARHQHISRAAEELMVAQPSLSRAVARLEADLGTVLFDRRGRRIRLNAQGEAFLRRVERVLGELDDARRELAGVPGEAGGTVSVAAETMLTLTGVLAGFRRAEPGVGFHLHQAHAEAMPRLLRDRRVDFCAASQPLAGGDLCGRELLREEVLLAVPQDHPWAARRSVRIEELAREPFVVPRPGYWQRALADRLFERAGVLPTIVYEGDEPGAMQDLIGAGLGVGLIPAVAREAGTRAAVAWLRGEAQDCERVLTLVWHRDAHLSPAARRFRDFAAGHFRAPFAGGRKTGCPSPVE
ncbi:LysR family transcriptional regulator [Nocardiopsis baichengensis]|uniref:LysR family transcriptional regulator n=1 Tax=Nocardiopsis baichengensis TaxID=280240 RepID=UPI000348013E|nr:LysR family transcriptional regulator [Nocardiopsis baichengensis]